METILSSDEAERLGIPLSCLPPYIAPLPQKESFSHLPSLKRIYLEKALCHLYRAHPLNQTINVTLFTWVIGDGLGDFSAQIETAKVLLAASMKVSLISLHPDRMPLTAPSLRSSHFLVPYQEGPNQDWNHISPVKIPQEALESLSKANVILQMPTYFPHTRKLLDPILQNPKHRPSYELIGEGGWGDTPRFSPLTGSRALGLRSWEKGLFFPKISLLIKSLQDSYLQNILAKTPFSKLCLGYIRNPDKCLLLAKTLLIQMQEDPSDIMLCLFPIEPLIAALPSLSSFFQEQGISEVRIYYEEYHSRIPLQATGKTLTLIQTKKLLREDYQSLLLQSNCLAGCRGDGSLSETLSAQKLPFFDFPLHKRPLLEGLLSIANHKLSSSHETSRYIQEFLMPEPNPYILGTLAKNPNTLLGFLELYPFLQEYYSAGDFIQNLTHRAAYHHFYPKIAILEKQILDSFLFGEKKAFYALQELQSELILHKTEKTR
ncbi:MAG: hypothetical protein V4489_08690 [Chlamydiota bacterium]